ncbi:MAG TPA: ATP-binding protein [Longimicrobiaceae bacterium]|jgi:two-component system NtrC family sensor kinase
MTESYSRPPAAGAAAEETFRRFALVGTGASLAWAPVWFVSGVPSVGAALLVAAAVIGGAYAARRRLGIGPAGHVAVGAAVAVVLGVVCVTGGIDGTRGVWVFVLPVAIALPLGVRAAAAWGVALLAATGGLWALELRGFAFPDVVPARHHAAVGAAVHLTVLALILLLSLAYARTRAAAVGSLHAANRSLEAVSADRERRAGRLAVLVDVARILASERSPDRLYRAFYVQLGRVLRRDAFYVALWDEASGTVRYPLMYDGGIEYPGERVPLGDGPTSRAIRERRTVVCSGGEDAGGTPWGNTRRASHAAVHAPLVKDGRVLGVLGVSSYAEPYSDEDVRLFESLADQAAVAVDNALLDRRVGESEARFREVLSSIERMVGHAVVITDLDGTIQYAGGTERVHGYPPEELVGRHVGVLGRNVPHADEISAAFLAATTRGEPWTQAVVATRRSGENFPILISASPYYAAGGEIGGVVTIGVDLTEQVEGERRLMQSAKLAAIGELVAGVAHELNNPLTVVKTTAELLEAGLRGEAAEDARSIREHADRAARIVRGLLHFARRTPHERSPTDLGEVVGRVCAFREGGLRAAHVALETRFAPDLPLTLADGPQLEQVVLNLLNNAEQAIASGRGRGRVAVSTEAGEGVLRFRVADDGPGIPEEVRARVFDPFFTTRGVGEGTGLGLAVSHGIVAEHGGSITVRSEPGAGAVFTVEIPLVPVPDPAAAPAPPAAAAEEPAPAPRRVLVVDDEAGLRRIVRRYLEGRGHRVDEAGSGAEALERIAAAEYDAVLLDLKMPEMPGDELFRLLRERHPATAARVVFATGDVISPARREFLDATGRPAFEKPFDLAEVAREVERQGTGDRLQGTACNG